MVLNVCRRVLGNVHEVDDAFQATFLILARRSRALVRRGSLAGWLYTVAYHTALRARAERLRQPGQQPQDLDMLCTESTGAGSAGELRSLLDAELSRLPDKYRLPLVLCYLEGKTNDEAARELNWPSGTVKGRLARARDLLRQRLARRGAAVTAVGLAAVLADAGTAVAVAPGLIQTTTQAAAAFATGQAATVAGSAKAVALAIGGLKAMTWMKLKLIATLVLVTAVLVGGAGLFTHQMLAAQQRDPTRAGEARADDKDAKPDERLLAALKDADLVFTAKITKSAEQAATNALPPTITGSVTFEDAKALRGRLPQSLDFRFSYRKDKDARMHLTKGDTVLVLAKALPLLPGGGQGGMNYSVLMSVPATEATVAAVKKALANQK
jgi:RNA polymerase sigma factor (sigma-70 family)